MRIEIEYWSAGRDAVTTRRIDPGPPFFALGEWYTDAFDHLRGEPRMFRVDRIRAAHPTGETFPPVPAGTPAAVYNPRPDDRRVTVELPASAAWVAESFPAEGVEDLAGGGQRVVLAVSETAWLERVLLRAGPGARVVGPAESTGDRRRGGATDPGAIRGHITHTAPGGTTRTPATWKDEGSGTTGEGTGR